MIKEIVKGMWQFVRFLFVPRWGRAQRGGPLGTVSPEENDRERKEDTASPSSATLTFWGVRYELLCR